MLIQILGSIIKILISLQLVMEIYHFEKFIIKLTLKTMKMIHLAYKKIGNAIENVLRPKDGILLDGINNIMIKYGKCCSPIPGDDVTGFVTRGRGLTVHRTKCYSLPLITQEEDRLVPVNWNIPKETTFNSRLKIIGLDYKGLLKNLSECIGGQNINIASVDIKVNGAVATAFFIVQIKE